MIELKAIFQEILSALGFTNLDRNQEMDILRCISTINVIIRHTFDDCIHPKKGHPVFKLCKFLSTFSDTCNSQFILISCMYLSKSLQKSYKLSRLIYILFTVYLIRILTYQFKKEVTHDKKPMTKQELLLFLFPIHYQQYWYPFTYIFSYIFFADSFGGIFKNGKRKHLLCIFILIYLATIGTINHDVTIFHWNGGYNFHLFFLLFYIGSYLSYYPIKVHWIILFFLNLLTFYISFLGHYQYFNEKNAYFPWLVKILNSTEFYSPLTVLFSVTLFLFFSNIKINCMIGKIFSYLAKFSLPIYAFHTNSYTWKIFMPGMRKIPPSNKFIIKFISIRIWLIVSTTFKRYFLYYFLSNLLIFNRQYYKNLMNKIDSFFESSKNPESNETSIPNTQLFQKMSQKEERESSDNSYQEIEYYSSY